MITPYYIPEVVKKWKDKEIIVTRFILYEVRPNGKMIHVCSYFFRNTARDGKAIMEKHFPRKKYAIVGVRILCK